MTSADKNESQNEENEGQDEAENQSHAESQKMTVNTFPLKTEDVTKIDYYLTELFESGRSKQQIMIEVRRFLENNQLRRERVLELYKSTLNKKKRQKALYKSIQDRNIFNCIYHNL